MSRLLIPAFVAIALACSACGPSAPPSDPTPSATEPTAQTSDPSPSAATAPGTPVTYACTDASPVSVAWGHDQARVEFADRSDEHTSELQSLMRISYAVFCLKKKNTNK